MAQISEKLRQHKIKKAGEWNKEKLADGTVKRMLIQMPAEVADEFDAICKELALSRPQAIKKLCEIYREKSE